MAASHKTRVTRPKPPPNRDEACIVRIYPPSQDIGRKFELTADIVIGREPSNTIVIDNDSVSRRHARIVRRGGQTVIVDLESTNGTYVNGAKASQTALRNGDLISVGDAIFKYLQGSVEALYHEEIYKLTIIDGLTEAYNKRYLLEHLDREIARSRRYSRPLAILMMDIDHFKSINDAHGHLAGDLVLREIGARIRTRIRSEEFFARYGGEEFSLVMPEATREAAMTTAEALRLVIAEHPFQFEGCRVPVTITISIGVGILDDRTNDPLMLLRNADDKLYQAKRAGRNCVMA